MQKVKVHFKNPDALQMLINATSEYANSQSILARTSDVGTKIYNNALLRTSTAYTLHHQLQRYVFRTNAKYPSNKSFPIHEAVIMQESLEFLQLRDNN